MSSIILGKDEYPEWIRKWSYLDRGDDHRYEMPALQNVQLVRYDDVLWAFGGKGLNDETLGTLTEVYKSRDNGITWKPIDTPMPPTDGVSIYNDAATSFSATTLNGRIWIVSAGTGEVWCGQLNRVAWGK